MRRLRLSFGEVEKLKDGTGKMWQEIVVLSSPDQRYANLRQATKTANPCIPYLGMYFEDITTIEVIRTSTRY